MKKLKNIEKKGQLDNLAKVILWVIFFLGAIVVTYFVIKFLKSLV